MKIKGPVAALLVSTALAGCTAMAPTADDLISVAALMTEIQCQIRDEIARAGATSIWDNYSASVALTVTALASSYANTGGYLGGPNFYVSGGGGATRQASESVRLPELTFRVHDLAALDCAEAGTTFLIVTGQGQQLLGAAFAFIDGGSAVGRSSNTFGAATEFSVFADVDGWFQPNASYWNGINAGRERGDTHLFEIAFTREAAPQRAGVSPEAANRLDHELDRLRDDRLDGAFRI